MNDTNTETLGWELIGWAGDDDAAHVADLDRAEILRIRDLFPRGDDNFLVAGAYEVPPALYPAMRAAVPRLEFREGLDYQVGGFALRLPADPDSPTTPS
ncbi:hypothetical protein ABZX93_20125 [Streptomyces sp. NPDC006632]|uniref:hypothetical protein n=1 Tax=Streptomyces sp. NPDC006632 TaxID=3157182 RepID=UPI0033A8D5DC